MIPHFGLLLRGASRVANDGGSFPIHSPHDGRTIATVSKATTTDLDAAVLAAQEGFRLWSGLTAYAREAAIRKATAHVRTLAEEIGRWMALEQGKPLAQCVSEVKGSCDTLDYYASEAPRIEGYLNPTEDKVYRSWVIHQPVGVCGLITPWNYPLSLLSWKLGPALATGCTVVVKPTTVTPISPLAFCLALIAGGLPPGVIQCIPGPGSTLGDAMVRHPGIAKIAMTGSSDVGKRILAAAALPESSSNSAASVRQSCAQMRMSIRQRRSLPTKGSAIAVNPAAV